MKLEKAVMIHIDFWLAMDAEFILRSWLFFYKLNLIRMKFIQYEDGKLAV